MDFQLLGVYTFETLAPSILGASIKNAVYQGLLTYDLLVVTRPGENIDLKYRQIFPLLPAGSLDDPKRQIYHTFKMESSTNNSEKIVTICDQWINKSTIRKIESLNFSIDFVRADAGDPEKVRRLLASAGFKDFVVR